MDNALCKLTLVYPPSIEETVVELLLLADPPLYGFTTWAAEGHGLDFSLASANERVRGRIKRGIMVLVLLRSRLPQLTELLKTHVKASGAAFWIEPVEQFERLAFVKPAPDDATSR